METLFNKYFQVNNEPYCIWDLSLDERNLEFIEQTDFDYFDYLAQTAISDLEREDHKQHAAMLMRQGLYHGLETLFSFIGALIQSPDCVYGWILKCNPGDVRAVIKRISASDNSLSRKIPIAEISWDNISKLIFVYSNANQNEVEINIKNFSQLWKKLAGFFIDEKYIAEYNSIKHGYRVQPGGFGLSIGKEIEPGKAAPPENMQTIGYSEFGTSFLRLEKLPIQDKSNRSYRTRRLSLNWSVEQTAILLQLVSMSLNNVLSVLKIINGVEASKVKFLRPEDPNMFEMAWKTSTSVISMTMDYTIDNSHFKTISKQEIKKIVDGITEKNIAYAKSLCEF